MSLLCHHILLIFFLFRYCTRLRPHPLNLGVGYVHTSYDTLREVLPICYKPYGFFARLFVMATSSHVFRGYVLFIYINDILLGEWCGHFVVCQARPNQYFLVYFNLIRLST